MPATFGRLLYRRIVARMTLGEFRRAVGISTQFLHQLVHDQVPMPTKRIPAFAALLCEGSHDRRRFILACALTHCPPVIVREFLRHRPDVLSVRLIVRNPPSQSRERLRRRLVNVGTKRKRRTNSITDPTSPSPESA